MLNTNILSMIQENHLMFVHLKYIKGSEILQPMPKLGMNTNTMNMLAFSFAKNRR